MALRFLPAIAPAVALALLDSHSASRLMEAIIVEVDGVLQQVVADSNLFPLGAQGTVLLQHGLRLPDLSLLPLAPLELLDAEGTAAAEGADITSRLKRLHPYYHTSREIDDEVKRLATVCDGSISVSSEQQDGVAITAVTVRSKSREGPAANRAFLLFGEHARELVSPESGLLLLRQLCGEEPMLVGQDREEFLSHNDMLLVLNANPRSRAKVESGDFCLRTNPAGVDLNRNWDAKWSGISGLGGSPGSEPFSEPETQILKRLVDDFRPTTFMTIHSGTRGMYMPWAYDMDHLATRNQPAMLAILEAVDAKHCECPFGAAGKEVGYSCPGTCVDYVYDKLATPYVFAYEIYTGKSPEVGARDSLQQRFEEQRAGSSGKPGSLLQLAASKMNSAADASEDMDPDYCFGIFNPNTEERYTSALSNWVGAYIETLSLVVQDIQKDAGIVDHVAE